MSAYVVGDVQGCFDELRLLLNKIGFRAGSDELIVAGDMINRGPNNLDTLKLLQDVNAKCVLGNHDLHFLAVVYGIKRPGRSDTLTQLLDSPGLDDIVTWFINQRLILTLDEFDSIVVHAGIPHVWSVETAKKHALEIESLLRSDEREEFFKHMYGNSPSNLSDEVKGMDRARVITNYFTRMRFCNELGQLELDTKTEQAPDGYAPWFSFSRPDSTRILFGHWAAIEGRTHSDQFVALDTGCVWGRSLTAIRLEDNRIFSVDALPR